MIIFPKTYLLQFKTFIIIIRYSLTSVRHYLRTGEIIAGIYAAKRLQRSVERCISHAAPRHDVLGRLLDEL